eukprot:scaffold98_cov100-Skeletonema_dohrnii-CCMP3373.AAC.2
MPLTAPRHKMNRKHVECMLIFSKTMAIVSITYAKMEVTIFTTQGTPLQQNREDSWRNGIYPRMP